MRITVPSFTSLLLFAGACGGGGGSATPDATPDTPPDMPPDMPPANVVTVDLFDAPPIFIAYREGTGPWQMPTETSNGYEMRVNSQYELVSVCGDATNGFDIGIEAATIAEIGNETFVPCFAPVSGSGDPPVSVKGTMVQPGSVATEVFNEVKSTTPNWSFELLVDPGVKDFVASGNNRVVVRRGIDASKATTLAKIDVVADPTSVALSDLALTVNGVLAGDTVSNRTRLTTRNFTLANISRAGGTTVKLAPDTLLQTNERQNITVNVDNGDAFRAVFFRHSATSPTTFDLLPPVAGVTFAAQSATWTSLPPGDVELDIEGATTFTHIFATKGFVGTATTLTETTDIPGFQDEWKPTNPDFRDLLVFDNGNGFSRESGIQEVLGALQKDRPARAVGTVAVRDHVALRGAAVRRRSEVLADREARRAPAAVEAVGVVIDHLAGQAQ